MATKTICDVCGKPVETEGYNAISLYSVGVAGTVVKNSGRIDLCKTCMDKVVKVVDTVVNKREENA